MKHTHRGKRLDRPEVSRPFSKFVKEIEWDQPEHADSYTVVLYRKINGSKKWKRVKIDKKVKENKLPFDLSQPSGTYKVKVQAKAKGRKSSDVAELEFPVKGGFRTPAAVEQAILKDSLNKPTNFYAIASYFISQVNYSNIRAESDSGSSFNNLAGTGRLGVGYQDPESVWGTFAIVDLSGINIDGENYTYSSFELHGTMKINTPGSGLLV
ncbi:MAG: hypothetical protein AAF202_12890, partial [Pseudomonadota bacterium]